MYVSLKSSFIIIPRLSLARGVNSKIGHQIHVLLLGIFSLPWIRSLGDYIDYSPKFPEHKFVISRGTSSVFFLFLEGRTLHGVTYILLRGSYVVKSDVHARRLSLNLQRSF